MPGRSRVLGGYMAGREEVQRAIVGLDEHREGGDREDRPQWHSGWKYHSTLVLIKPISPTRTVELEAGSSDTTAEARKAWKEERPS